MSGGVYIPTYPDSEEPGDVRTARAIKALEYEEKAGLGFRRRDGKHGAGDPYGSPEDHQVTEEETTGQLVAGYLAGIGVVAGIGTFFVKPVVFAVIALFFCTFAMIAGGQAAKTGRIGLMVASVGWVFGMLVAIIWDRPIF